MKKLTSLEDLKSIIPKDYKSEDIIKSKSNIKNIRKNNFFIYPSCSPIGESVNKR